MMRLFNQPFVAGVYLDQDNVLAVLGLLGACYTIIKGFGKHWSCIFQHPTVWTLVLMAIVAAFCTNVVDDLITERIMPRSWKMFFKEVLLNSNSYIELMAFVPAVWMVFREAEYTS